MNIQEREQLTRFLQQLTQAQVGSKDAEADRLIQETCGRQPDAPYLLVQRSLLLDHALENAQTEITSLKRELDNSRGKSGGFLNSNAWGNTPVQSIAPQPTTYPPITQAPAAPASTSSWGSGILGSVATTAAGVVAGSFLFQGIEHLMGNRGGGSGFLSGHDTLDQSLTPIENVATNTYDDSINTSSDFAEPGGLEAFDP